jgi:hypothetical protein
MTKDDPVASIRASSQPFSDEYRADSLSLAVRNHGQRCEGQGVDLAALRCDGQLAEQDVADDPSLVLGNQG